MLFDQLQRHISFPCCRLDRALYIQVKAASFDLQNYEAIISRYCRVKWRWPIEFPYFELFLNA